MSPTEQLSLDADGVIHVNAPTGNWRSVEATHEKRRVETVCEQFDRGEVVVPDWHRGYFWTEEEASLMVESVLLGIVFQTIYVARRPDKVEEIIDGQQRLRALSLFAQDDLRLRGLKVCAKLNGRTFSELPRHLQLRFRLHPVDLTVYHEPTYALKVWCFHLYNS